MSSPIATFINSILLISDEGEEYNVELFAQNNYCQFERIEMEESVNNIFPTGALIVRDLGDIVSYVGAKSIKKFTVSFATGEKYTWYITSITYTNNMASEIDQTYVVLYFSNKIYFESQSASFYVQRERIVTDSEDSSDTEETQESLDIWHTPYPFITNPEHIAQVYGKKRVFSAPEFESENAGITPDPNSGCGVNLFIKNTQNVVNYVLFRPRIADGLRREQFQTNIVNYLNYIFTYAINSERKPFYMFWTDFANCLNYKFFDLKTDLESGSFGFDLPDSDPGQIKAYAIYDSSDVSRPFTIEDQSDIQCTKIYVLVTNPAYSFTKKNYYYLRSNPLYMEDTDLTIGGTFSTAINLMSPFLSESSNTSLATITTYTSNYSPGLTYSLRYSSTKDKNLVFLPDKGYAGYSKDFYYARSSINVADATSSYENLTNLIESTPLGLRDSYAPDTNDPPLYPYNDNLYMWQYQFDVTRTHPNIQTIKGAVPGEDVEGPPSPEPQQSISIIKGIDFYQELFNAINTQEDTTTSQTVRDILNDVTMNKVLIAKYEAMKEQEKYENQRREELIKTEKENFVANVLCCIGKDLSSEEWFFAEITGFVKDDRTKIGSKEFEPLTDAWIYSWKKLEPGPYIAGLTGLSGPADTKDNDIVAAQHNMFHGWTGSQCVGSTGSVTAQESTAFYGFTGIDTWAINLNERFNGYSNQAYRGPGYNSENYGTVGNFAIKPIGFTGQFFTGQNSGSAKHIVKMYRMSVNDLRAMGAAPADSAFSSNFVYYFMAENAVDGACNV